MYNAYGCYWLLIIGHRLPDHGILSRVSQCSAGQLAQHDMLHRTALSTRKQFLELLSSVQAAGNPSVGGGHVAGDSHSPAFAAGLAAAVAVSAVTGATVSAADATTDDTGSSRSWFSRLTGGSGNKAKSHHQQQQQQQPPAASGAAVWQQQQQQQLSGLGGEPLSGAIPLLTEDGLTNHPLDYNPITNEHTAAMTMAKQAGLEAYQAGRYSDAERRFQEALTEARLGFPDGDPHIPSAMHCLAELYRNTGRYEQAQQLYEQAAANLLENLGDRHWMYVSAICSLAQLHEAKGEYDKAITLLEQALQLREQLFSKSSYLYADTASHLGVVLMKKHNAAAAAGSSTDGSSSSSSGWFGRGKRDHDHRDPDVDRAIKLLQHAIMAVEEAGHVEETPAAAWLVELAAAQRTQQQHTAAVESLKKAMSYMAMPRKTEEQKQLEQQQQQGAAGEGNGDSSSSSGGTPDSDDLQLQRLKLIAQASDVSERLVDAELACGDVAAAATAMRQAVEARTVLYGRHLVVAKSMTRLANLLMQQQQQSSSVDPQAVQLAQHYASSAVAIAENALQGAQRASLWSGLLSGVRGSLSSLSSASRSSSSSSGSRSDADKAAERLMAAVQLGNACLALAAAEKLISRSDAAESSLRKAVSQLRWVLAAGNEDLQRLSQVSNLEAVVFDRVAGLLVDLKLLQMDCLEALAAAMREQGGAAAGRQHQPSSNAAAAAAASDGGDDSEEIRMLLGEAELLAAELYAD